MNNKIVAVFLSVLALILSGCGNVASGTDSVDSQSEIEEKIPTGVFYDLVCGMSFEEVVELMGDPASVNIDNNYAGETTYHWKINDRNLVDDKFGKCSELRCTFADNKLNYAEASVEGDDIDTDSLLSDSSGNYVETQNGYIGLRIEEISYYEISSSIKSCTIELCNRTINAYPEDKGDFYKLKCGMDFSEVQNILGNEYCNFDETYFWRYKNNNTFDTGDSDKPTFSEITCNFSGDKLYNMDFSLYYDDGRTSAEKCLDELLKNNSQFSTLEESLFYTYGIAYNDTRGINRQHNGELGIYSPTDDQMKFSFSVRIAVYNFDYVEESPKTDSPDTTDGKVGDNDGDGDIDDDDWEIEWKDYLENEYEKAGV